MAKDKQEKWYGVKFLIPYIKKYKFKIAIMAFSMVMVALSSALNAYMMKPILNNIFVDKDENMLTLLPILVVVLFVARGLFRFLSSYFAQTIGVDITNTIRSQMFEKAVNAQYSQIQSKTIGDINAHIIQTLLNLRNVIAKTLPSYFISFMTIIALIGLILFLNWKLSLIAIAFASILVFPIKYFGKKVKSHVLNAEKMISGLTDSINETFTHIDLVKVYNNTDYEKKRFDKVLNNYQKFQLKLSKYQEATSPIMELFVSLAIASVIYFGGLMVIKEGMTVGDFFAFVSALMMLYAPIKVVTKNSLVLNILDTYVKRIENILKWEQEQENKEPLNEPIKSVEFKNVSLKIGKKEILKNISFKIENLDTVAIVGKTGAGKSSIISLIFGFRKPTSGEILINGKNINTLNLKSLRDKISYVNQAAGAFNATVEENILYGLEYDKTKYEQAKAQAGCNFVEELEKKDKYIVGENGKKLSGGQRQRLALARAIYKNASLFILDEATSALDANTESIIQKSLEELMNSKTTIVIAHRLSTIKNAKNVLVVSNGEIVESGSYEKVSKTETFKNNFDIK